MKVYLIERLISWPTDYGGCQGSDSRWDVVGVTYKKLSLLLVEARKQYGKKNVKVTQLTVED